MPKVNIELATVCRTGGGWRLVTLCATLVPLLLLDACSTLPDWADPIDWFEDNVPPTDVALRNSGALQAKSADVPGISSVPGQVLSPTGSAVRRQIKNSLVADRANADYTGERLIGGLGAALSEPAVPQVPAPLMPAQQTASQQTSVSAPRGTRPSSPPLSPDIPTQLVAQPAQTPVPPEAGVTPMLQATAETEARATPPPPPAMESEATAGATVKQTATLPPATTLNETSIIFSEGSAELSHTAMSQLEGVAKFLSENESTRIRLLAFARGSDDGTRRARRLSLSRALSVRAFLIERGVHSTRMDVHALGNKIEDGSPDRVDILPQRAGQ